MWRFVFYGLVGAVGLSTVSSPYVSKASPGTMAASALFPFVIYVPIFLWWLRDKSLTDVRPIWRGATLQILDRTCLFVAVMQFFALIAVTKGSIGHPYWADPQLAAIDHWIFGTDPWKLTHEIFGPGITYIDWAYGVWPLVMLILTLSIVTLSSSERAARFVLATALAWVVLGIFTAHALASAGPIFGPDLGFGFDDLRTELDQSAPYSAFARTYLWDAYSTGSVRIASGISAMPSMHCALVFVLAFTAYRTRWFPAACAYAAFIWIASVTLGWHYFTDGLVSLIGVAALWPVAGYIANWQSQPRMGQPTTSPA